MKHHLALLTMFLFTSTKLVGQSESPKDSVETYFEEVKTVTREAENLWGFNLYAPILLVNPKTREVFANVPDTASMLRKDGAIYMGHLPKSINIANTSMRWSGVHWAMVMLPLPEDKHARLNLLAHELFHRAQPQLGFTLFNTDNNHLDQRDGRIYLRLELEALKSAVLAHSKTDADVHLTHALAFRRYRHIPYPQSDSTENQLELNEGLAEFTGIMLSGRTREQMQAHFVRSLEKFLSNPSFVRSFAYQTIPMYGYLLQDRRPGWNRAITAKTNLTEYFTKAFQIKLSDDLENVVQQNESQYGGRTIMEEETAREAEIAKTLAAYKHKFLIQPHLDIPLQNMNISFDPRYPMPLEDKGTVYPGLRVTDNWGILTATNGALVSSGWNKLTVSAPTRINPGMVEGDGWTLELKAGYAVSRDDQGGNYRLGKR